MVAVTCSFGADREHLHDGRSIPERDFSVRIQLTLSDDRQLTEKHQLCRQDGGRKCVPSPAATHCLCIIRIVYQTDIQTPFFVYGLLKGRGVRVAAPRAP